MGRHEVTRREFALVMGRMPTPVAGDSAQPPQAGDPTDSLLPVAAVTWEEAARFCLRLSNMPAEREDSRRYRLPREAEWEYAGLAGSQTAYSFGDSLETGRLHAERSSEGPVAVGSFPANAWGLHDMHGNLAEWVADRYDDRYPAEPHRTDPTGPGSGVASNMVIRGGGWRHRFVEAFDMWGRYDRHLHSSFNVIVHTEGDGLTRYWQPQRAGQQAFVRFRYYFDSPVVSAWLWANTLTFGEHSDVILEVAEATGNGRELYVEVLRGRHENYDEGRTDISNALAGATTLFVQARLTVEKGEPTNRAQFLRSSPASHFSFPHVYQLIVELEESDCRSAARSYAPASFRDAAVGFRVVCVIAEPSDNR